MPEKWLYRYEAKGIQSYVLGTQRLHEIAGASALVDDLDDLARKRLREIFSPPGTSPHDLAKIADDHVVLLAAGGGTLLFDSRDQLEQFAATWLLWCQREVPGLQVVQAWVSVAGNQPDAKDFSRLYQRLEVARQQPWVDLPEVGPFVLRTARTGLPAVGVDARGEKGTLVDETSCQKQRKAKEDSEDWDGLLRRLRRGANPDTPPDARSWRFLRDNNDFPEGYVAIIHADGNGVGGLLAELQLTAPELKVFSAALRDATLQAAHLAIAALVDELPKDLASERRQLAVRPVVLGGDDLTFLVHGSQAMTFVENFLQEFQKQTRLQLQGRLERVSRTRPDGLTASAGIAFVKSSFPFFAAYELAEELCQFAKRHTRRQNDAESPSSFAFHRVTTAAIRPWEDIVSEELAGGALVGGPWRLDEVFSEYSWKNLKSLVDRVLGRTLPRGSLRRWIRAVQEDHQSGQNSAERAWKRMIEVLQHSRDAEGLLNTLAELGTRNDGFRKEKSTPLWDALTLASVRRGAA